ncbi:MAG: PorT family protein [Hymenobacter sp.]|nr:PorT family protein [Hymenobacter sp.]
MKATVLQTLLAAALLLTAGAAQAQISFGPRVGLNLASVRYKTNYSLQADPDTKIKVGAQVGVTLNARFGNLAVQPSVLFSQKGYTTDESGSQTIGGATSTYERKDDVRLNYLDVPVNLVYTPGGLGFQVFAGPYLGIGLGGRVEGESELEETALGGSTRNSSNKYDYQVAFADSRTDDNKAYYRRVNLGLNGGIGYRAGPVQAQLGYALGLSDMLPNTIVNGGSKMKDGTVQFALTYLFGAGN